MPQNQAANIMLTQPCKRDDEAEQGVEDQKFNELGHELTFRRTQYHGLRQPSLAQIASGRSVGLWTESEHHIACPSPEQAIARIHDD